MKNLSRRWLIKKFITLPIVSIFAANASQKNGNINKEGRNTCVFVDDFGADPSGVRDSTSAVIFAAQSINGAHTSGYNGKISSYGEVKFGRGTYIIGDVPFYTGIKYKGAGKFATRISPKPGSKYCFLTTRMERSRLYQSGIENMIISSGYQDVKAKNATPPPIGVGGVHINEASYFTLSDVVIRYVDGAGLFLGNVWDSDFLNLRIMECGNTRDINNPLPGILIGPGDSYHDGTNAVRFYGFHVESCRQLMQIQERTRHVFFISPKIESHHTDSISSTIKGVRGVTFNCPELTWSRSDIFMFDMVRKSERDDNQLLVFNTPTLISNLNHKGSYFIYDSHITPLVITNAQMRGVSILASGRNIKINGGTACFSGPGLVIGNDNIEIKDVSWHSITIGKYIYTPVISVNGANCIIDGNKFVFDGRGLWRGGVMVGDLCKHARITNNHLLAHELPVLDISSSINETAIISGNILSEVLDSQDS
ncbi:MAG: hypothetical protein ACSLEM_04800 [Candidatus Malihini olakiniferum]